MDNLYFLDKELRDCCSSTAKKSFFQKWQGAMSYLKKLIILIKGFQVFKMPILATEQYPQGLGKTIPEIRDCLRDSKPISKTAFSCFLEPPLRKQILKLPHTHWVLSGIETHVCVLQTAKDLLAAGKNVIIINDATSCRNIADHSSAIQELSQYGARITTTEACLFELVRDAQTKEFKDISLLIK